MIVLHLAVGPQAILVNEDQIRCAWQQHEGTTVVFDPDHTITVEESITEIADLCR